MSIELRKGTIIMGKNVKIHGGAQIGFDGFRYNRKQDGSLEEIPHEFGVVIEDNVRIGSNVTIDSGRWRDTTIKEGSKIDNSAHIAHNVIIGKHNLIHAFVNLCGGVEIGDRCEIFPHANIQPHVKICDDVIIGDHAIIRKNILFRN